MDVTSARREPVWQEYHTGSPAAGRESAARAMCSTKKDVRKADEVAGARENHFFLDRRRYEIKSPRFMNFATYSILGNEVLDYSLSFRLRWRQ
jgi:hypothetical protein